MFVNNSVVVIPAYRPQKSLLDFINELKQLNLNRVIVVDDGSGEKYQNIFDNLRRNGVHVVSHDNNKGKGCALKTGISVACSLFPNSDIVTADSDGQHLAADVYKINEKLKENSGELILGVRDFKKAKVPYRSIIGNFVASGIFYHCCHVRCQDTQTGLRGIPQKLLNLALSTEGDGFEYETNFLMAASTSCKFNSVQITTLYKNEKSNFSSIKDSYKILKCMAIFSQTNHTHLRR